MAHSKRREGRSVLDPRRTRTVRAENFQAAADRLCRPRVLSRFRVSVRGYPASFFGPWLCACVWHESMLLSCVWRASRTVASSVGRTDKAPGGGWQKNALRGFPPPVFPRGERAPRGRLPRPHPPLPPRLRPPRTMLSASSLVASSSSSSSLAVSPAISSRFSPAWISVISTSAPWSSDPSPVTTASFATSAIAPARYRGSDTLPFSARNLRRVRNPRVSLVDGRRLPGTATPDRGPQPASRNARRPAGARDRDGGAGDASARAGRDPRGRGARPSATARANYKRARTAARATDTRSWKRDAGARRGRGARAFGRCSAKEGATNPEARRTRQRRAARHPISVTSNMGDGSDCWRALRS